MPRASFGASHLLTAHHRDDLAEALVLRLRRGAGVFGLAAMRPAVDANGIVLARPFLDVPRARLAATCAASGLVPVVDAMNSDPRFARARVRTLLPLLAREGLDPARLAATARRLADAADAVDAAAGDLIAAQVAVDDFAVARLDAGPFRAAPAAVRARVAVRLLMAVGGGDYPPRFERLAALTEAMTGETGGRFKRTLSGCVVEQRDGGFVFYRELGREGPPAVALKPGTAIVWDRRFQVSAGPSLPAGLAVAALGEAGAPRNRRRPWPSAARSPCRSARHPAARTHRRGADAWVFRQFGQGVGRGDLPNPQAAAGPAAAFPGLFRWTMNGRPFTLPQFQHDTNESLIGFVTPGTYLMRQSGRLRGCAAGLPPVSPKGRE